MLTDRSQQFAWVTVFLVLLMNPVLATENQPPYSATAAANAGLNEPSVPASRPLDSSPTLDGRRSLIDATDHDTLIDSDFGQLKIRSGSVVYVIDNGKVLIVYNLHSDPGAVNVVYSDKQVEVLAGQRLVLMRTSAASLQKLPLMSAARLDKAEKVSLSETINGFKSEFSVASVVLALPEFRAKLSSPTPENKLLFLKLLRHVPPPPPIAKIVPYVEHLVLYEEQTKTINSKFGSVVCAPGSAAFICETGNSLAVFGLDEKKKADIRIDLDSNKFVSVRASEEVVVTKLHDADFYSVNPKTGILFRALQAPESLGECRIFRAEFMIEKAIHQISELRKFAASNDPAQHRILQRIIKSGSVQQPTARQELSDLTTLAKLKNVSPPLSGPSFLQGGIQTLEESHYNPNAKVIDLTVIHAARTSQPEAKFDRDVYWLKETAFDWKSVESKTSDDNQVSAIISCSKDCVLKTELSLIQCKQGALVFVDNHEHYLTVCTLDSKNLKDVAVEMTSSQPVKLPPGCALVLRKQKLSGTRPTPAHLMTYRAWSEKKTAGQIDFYGADFSLNQAMYFVQPLRKMIKSENAGERAKARRILKNATILAEIDPGSSYQP